EVMQRAAGAGAGDPVGGELRDGRQDLLRLRRPQPGGDPGTRPPGRLPGKPDIRDQVGDRPDDGGEVGGTTFANQAFRRAATPCPPGGESSITLRETVAIPRYRLSEG